MLARAARRLPRSRSKPPRRALNTLILDVKPEQSESVDTNTTKTIKLIITLFIIAVGTIFLVLWQALFQNVAVNILKLETDTMWGNFIFTILVTVLLFVLVYIYTSCGNDVVLSHW